ncbi:hypothetical protein TcCL_Unassigned03800 [Trypanosoma cruzi]|nr:hypothetical protein TcCL_Unassigned03800 [Trypanosoma cruzi]
MVKTNASLWCLRAATRLGGKKSKIRRLSTWKEGGTPPQRPSGSKHSAASARCRVRTLRGGCGHATVPHSVTPSKRNSRRVSFRSHSWRCRHPLPFCVLLASTTILKCDRGCPAGAVLGWVGSVLRGETPSATLDRCAHALPSTPLPPFGNRTAASTLSPKQHTRENVAAYLTREQSDGHTLRPSCRQVRRKRTHTHSSRHTKKEEVFHSVPCPRA